MNIDIGIWSFDDLSCSFNSHRPIVTRFVRTVYIDLLLAQQLKYFNDNYIFENERLFPATFIV